MDDAKRGLLIGVALGDGYVQVRQRLQPEGYTWESRSLRVVHGSQQRAYCEWIAERVGWALGGRQIAVHQIANGPGGKYVGYHFMVSHPYFGQVHRWVYPNGKKQFTRKVLDMLTPEGVAVWYMDDGSARRNVSNSGWVTSVATDIATMCSLYEAEEIIRWFKDRFDIEWKIRCRKASPEDKAFYLQCNTRESHRFIDIIREFIPECMLYKAIHVADLCSHERQTSIGSCSHCGRKLYDKRRGDLCSGCYGVERKRANNG